ncbi:hypothetical protein BT69DRAFT_1212816 [Atractiella rhizophila]|nr:hypothetical protein BT69DRAFT_1212816 [Atractiella rhizophila]
MAVFPPEGTGSVSITYRDFNRLVPEEFLNDTLIEYGLRKIQHDLRAEGLDVADQVHIFNSFFYKKLTHSVTEPRKKPSKIDYESVRKWTSKVDIFDKKYVIIPINEQHVHSFFG